MSGPHDQLSRRTFTLPAELRLALPAEVVALLDWSTLHVESEIVIDPGLEETEKDIVYSIRLLTGQQAYVLGLFEHLSSPDRWVPLRLLNYTSSRISAPTRPPSRCYTPLWEHSRRRP
jgi:predicted transposase YdaD